MSAPKRITRPVRENPVATTGGLLTTLTSLLTLWQPTTEQTAGLTQEEAIVTAVVGLAGTIVGWLAQRFTHVRAVVEQVVDPRQIEAMYGRAPQPAPIRIVNGGVLVPPGIPVIQQTDRYPDEEAYPPRAPAWVPTPPPDRWAETMTQPQPGEPEGPFPPSTPMTPPGGTPSIFDPDGTQHLPDIAPAPSSPPDGTPRIDAPTAAEATAE